MNPLLIVLVILVLTLKYQAVHLLGFDPNIVDWVCMGVIALLATLSIWIVDWDKEG